MPVVLSEALKKSISASISQHIQSEFGVERISRVSGGCINSAYRIEGDGLTFFLKLNRAEAVEMFAAEFTGLAELYAAHSVRVPRPICCGHDENHAWLVTEFIVFGRKTPESARLLGEQLARLHAHHADAFGWSRNNTIGSTPQINTWNKDWPTFFGRHRLGYQLELAVRNGFGRNLQAKGERLLDGLNAFFAPYTPQPSLLHGDLWGGNWAADKLGKPVIFDPAVYYGDREADVAMTELFGGFGPEFYAAYASAWPLDDAYPVRKQLYNLYHVLNHANIFGGGYAHQAESMIDRLLSEIL